MGPAPAQPVNGELSHEDGGQLSQGQQGKVPEHATRQVHRVQLRHRARGINTKKGSVNILWSEPFKSEMAQTQILIIYVISKR